ncbi:MAG TPA: acyl-CoA carboxylase epsilon subunit [Pseudonocardiaceae bacterium]|nr:acyl-CoA carboxylase epsilon subunit [Pseudonocardiaceae bacterium]
MNLDTFDVAQPEFRVLRGAPDDAELAALVVVLAALTTPEPAAPRSVSGGWGDRSLRARLHRRPKRSAPAVRASHPTQPRRDTRKLVSAHRG